MIERLKNAGGSFSRMTAKVLHSQIGKNVLVGGLLAPKVLKNVTDHMFSV
jgi:hypothetical protein